MDESEGHSEAVRGAADDDDQPMLRHTSSTVDMDTYNVSLHKSGGMYGIAYRATMSEGLVVTGILPRSSAHEWNLHCESVEDVICVGDRFLSINSQTEPKSMVETLVMFKRMRATLLKSGPRWHVGGKHKARPTMESELFNDTNLQLQIAYEVASHDPRHNMSSSSVTAQEGECSDIRRADLFIMFWLVALPNILLVSVFSDMGTGLDIVSALAEPSWDFLGTVLIGCGALFGCLLYILDWSQLVFLTSKVVSAACFVYTIFLGWIMKIRVYPSAPLVIILFHVPVALGLQRVILTRKCNRGSFYKGAAVCTGTVGMLILAVWLLWINVDFWDGANRYDEATRKRLIEESSTIYANWKFEIDNPQTGETYERAIDYDWDCDPDNMQDYDFILEDGYKVATSLQLGVESRLDRAEACAAARTTWFLFWIAPLIASIVNMILSFFCIINGVLLDAQDASKMEKVLKQFILMIILLLMFMWVSASIAGASMRLTSTLLAFSGTGLILLFVWMYFEIGRRAITASMHHSKVMQGILAMATSDWVRGALVVALNGLIPSFLLLNILNQTMRRMRGRSHSDSWFTARAEGVLAHLADWNWTSILTKANWWVILYWTLSIGVAKGTYVFLSYLNELLLELDLAAVMCIFFCIGFTMFLLPPVPGVPVYITAGIIVTARGEKTEGVGFLGGMVLASTLSFGLKLLASSGQYMIGFFLGKSVKIQQTVGVHKVMIKAIEKILKTKGFNVPKVAVLVGGPDWPTSVICGILRLNLFQVILGTTPVILVSTPCVVAGSLLVYDSEDGMWDTLASTMLLVSGAGQMACMGLAAYYIQECVSNYGDELAKPRPEHAAILALYAKEAEFRKCYREVTDFWQLTRSRQVEVVMSTTLIIAALFLFQFMDTACFRPFEISNKICDGYEVGGLNCDALSIILPTGWAALGLFFVACVLHCFFLHTASIEAQQRMAALTEEAAMRRSCSY